MAEQKITTFLTYKDQAEEAVALYTSVFKNSRILNTTRYGDDVPGPTGKVMTIEFELDGQRFVALNGGEHFTFTDGISLLVNCDTQEEIDEYWERLTAGGEEVQCGWLKDRFGVSWQIVPKVIGDLIGGPDPEGARRATQAMLQMKKLDIKTLQDAYNHA